MKHMLIIGGAGFIGVNAAAHFADRGWKVTVFDNFSRRGTDMNEAYLRTSYPAIIDIVRGDIRHDTKQLLPLVEASDMVLHLAAQVAVTTSVVNPREDFDINALGTFNVLEVVRESKRRPLLLFASTNKVYGGLEHLPVTEGETRYAFANNVMGVNEATPLDFHSPYGCSKGAADQYVRDYARIYGLKTVVFRQSCIYGPNQFGVEDQGWVAWFMIAGLLGKPVTIYGNGKQVRDLLYVQDLIALYEAAIDQEAQMNGQIYNVGGGAANTVSLREFLDTIQNDLKLSLTMSYADWRPGDQPIFVSDNAKALRELGWQPTTDVKIGFSNLFNWLKDHKEQIAGLYTRK